jgi:ribosomal protein L4
VQRCALPYPTTLRRDRSTFDAPSTRKAVELIGELALPLLVIADPGEEALVKSFRNVEKVLVSVPSDLEVAEVVWARTLLVSESALESVQKRAS